MRRVAPLVAGLAWSGEALAPSRAVSALERAAAQQPPETARAGPTRPGCRGLECVREYVNAADATYEWHDTGARLAGTDPVTGMPWRGTVLNMTSQRWLSEAEIDRPVWWHIVVAVEPEVVEFPDWALVHLSFGSYDGDLQLTRIDNRHADTIEDQVMNTTEINGHNLLQSLPELTNASAWVAGLATKARAMGVCVLNLPNNYEIFASDTRGVERAGDRLKGYSYGEFMDDPSRPEVISELPVAKAVVRAFDTISDFTGGRVVQFGLAGHSKLGTATFMTGAIDDRVKAIAPAAIYLAWADTGLVLAAPSSVALAESGASSNHRRRRGGVMTSAEARNTMELGEAYSRVILGSGSPAYEALTAIIDPASWLDQLTMPALYVMATNDDVLPAPTLDKAQNYLKKFPPQARFLEVANCEHDNALNCASASVAAFFRGVLLGKALPAVDWDIHDAATDGDSGIQARPVSADSGDILSRVRSWTGEASSAQTGSFLDTVFESRNLAPLDGGVTYESLVDGPTGPRASFVDFEFEWPEPGFSLLLSTPLVVSGKR